MTEFLKEWWPALGAMISGIFWLGRLESRANSNTREIVDLKTDLNHLEARLAAQRAEDIANRRRDQDETNKVLSEIRSDIKKLLAAKSA